MRVCLSVSASRPRPEPGCRPETPRRTKDHPANVGHERQPDHPAHRVPTSEVGPVCAPRAAKEAPPGVRWLTRINRRFGWAGIGHRGGGYAVNIDVLCKHLTCCQAGPIGPATPQVGVRGEEDEGMDGQQPASASNVAELPRLKCEHQPTAERYGRSCGPIRPLAPISRAPTSRTNLPRA
jgi:hypothetical protein